VLPFLAQPDILFLGHLQLTPNEMIAPPDFFLKAGGSLSANPFQQSPPTRGSGPYWQPHVKFASVAGLWSSQSPETSAKVADLMQGPLNFRRKSAEVMTPSLNGLGITEDIFEASCLIFNQALNRGEAVAMAAGGGALKMLLVWKIFKILAHGKIPHCERHPLWWVQQAKQRAWLVLARLA
jgi:hypothetical protein